MEYVKTPARSLPLFTTAARLVAAGLLVAALAACGTASKPAPGAQSSAKSSAASSSGASSGGAPSGSPSSRSAQATPDAKSRSNSKSKSKGRKAPATASGGGAATPKAPAAGALAGTFVWPADGSVIARFNGGSSKGIDIAGRPGDPVIAASAGRVVFAGSTMRGYGNLVMLKHSDNLLTAYAHNRKLLVKENESVRAGQRIAEMGSSDSNVTKLHFELRRAGQAVDPLPYLKAQGAAPAP